ncbi:hypothetical protein CspeluHIS016_0600400 [Cutaneotrichosporon spelunceum]|uniref:Aquaporin n=1 Tax=Cutaneotrichosporon spelunceum TaxID=1672016 RepID=A0AAD3YDY8_9TREE|nr:hypothetical protein CspeluHIS016_0600400 [Cutaneotrichosporon spelunceum]
MSTFNALERFDSLMFAKGCDFHEHAPLDSASAGMSTQVAILPVTLDAEAQRMTEAAGPLTIRVPPKLQPYLAEGFGTGVMILIGLISNIQSALTGDPEKPTTINDVAFAFGWGIALMAGLFITIDISGGHVNPAVTFTQALFRGFSWHRVLGYWAAQMIGTFLAACIVLGLYSQLLDQYEGRGVRTWRTATLFIIRPMAWESNINAFFNEVVATVLLFLGVAVATDPGAAGAWQMWSKALIMNWIFIAVNGCMGIHPGYALNPARDLGVRLACLAFGYTRELFTDRNCYWIWLCIIAPFFGGTLSTFLYDWVVRGRVEFTVPGLRRLICNRRGV